MLVAEDHERLARSVAAGLPCHGMTVDIALDGDDALARLDANRYDVVILDQDLPGTAATTAAAPSQRGAAESSPSTPRRQSSPSRASLVPPSQRARGPRCLLVAAGKPVSAEELLELVWDPAVDSFTSTVKVTMNRLRATLGDPPIIETVRDRGYPIGGQ